MNNNGRIYATINDQKVDVTTVMNMDITYKPTKELADSIMNGMEQAINTYMPNILKEQEGIYQMANANTGIIWENKGWIISAMEKHPNYNGNLQIILPECPMNRYINMKDINEFFSWTDTNLRKHTFYKDHHGNKISKDEWVQLIDKYTYLRDRAREIYRNHEDTLFEMTDQDRLIRKIANRIFVRARDIIWSIDTTYYTYSQEMECFNSINSFIDMKRADAQFADELIAYKINRKLKDDRFCAAGQKISKIINKLGKRCGLNKIVDIWEVTWTDQNGIQHSRPKDFGWNHYYSSKLADGINPIEQKATAVISVNPVDFLTMSIGTNWASCMTIDKNNIHHISSHTYHGMYCGGTLSYMLDKATVILYYLAKGQEAGDHPEFLPKEKRCLFYLGEDKLIQSRVYPDGRDSGDESLAGDIRKIMQKIIADLFDVPNYWTNSMGTRACYDVTESYGVHYKDYLNYEDCNVSYMKRLDGYKNKRIVYIGHESVCPECGEEHETSDNIFCERCTNPYICADCGCVIDDPDDAFEIDGEIYCHNCVNYCDECGHYVHSEMTMVGHYHYVCQECLAENFTYCEYDDAYVRDYEVVETEEGNCYSPESDGYGICCECGECHDFDELTYDEATDDYYCNACFDNLMDQREAEENEAEDIA